MLKELREIVLPFSEIARELRILRELYELDLASREVPVRRMTEAPRDDDTQIFYANDEPKRPPSALEKLFRGRTEDQEESDLI